MLAPSVPGQVRHDIETTVRHLVGSGHEVGAGQGKTVQVHHRRGITDGVVASEVQIPAFNFDGVPGPSRTTETHRVSQRSSGLGGDADGECSRLYPGLEGSGLAEGVTVELDRFGPRHPHDQLFPGVVAQMSVA